MRDEELRRLRDELAGLRGELDEVRHDVRDLGRAVRGLHLVISELCDDATIDADDVLEPVDELLARRAFDMP